MLASEPGKVIVSTIRPAVNDVAATYVSESQYGSGLNKGSTDYVHLYVKAPSIMRLLRRSFVPYCSSMSAWLLQPC